MKHLLFIFTCILFTCLFAIDEVHEGNEWMACGQINTVETSVSNDEEDKQTSEGALMAISAPRWKALVTSTETQSYARHLRNVSQRIQLLTQSKNLFVKELVRKLSKYISTLTVCATRVYTTLRCINWQVPSDCYVFGIRHIII